MVKKIVIGSLQYSPIYKSHCCALGKQCEKEGYSVKYIFSHEYEWMLPEDIINKTVFVGKSTGLISALIAGLNVGNIQKLNKALLEYNPDYIYMYNYHPFLNYYMAILSHKHGSTFIQHIQEPCVEDKSAYKGFKQYWLYLFEYFQEKLLDRVDIAVLSSKRALYLFDKRYGKFVRTKTMIPLMYEDLGNDLKNIGHRKYITFIGPPVPAKGPETFLDIVDYSNKNGLNFKFLLISNSEVNSSYYEIKNLEIFYKDKISDEIMGDFIKNSLMTVTPYKVATQSSVILTSYMYGTPVLSTNVGGLPEVVHHLKTGYLLDENSIVEEWINGVTFILNNHSEMSKYCRDYFTREFSEINWPKYFFNIFGGER